MREGQVPKNGAQGSCASCSGIRGHSAQINLTKHNWDGVTIEGFVDRIGEYVERYNTKRIKRSLGGMSPTDYGKRQGLSA